MGGEWPGSEAASSPSTAEDKNEWSHTATPPGSSHDVPEIQQQSITAPHAILTVSSSVASRVAQTLT